MPFTRAPFARLAAAHGIAEMATAFTYQDYLYELLADGSSEKPVTEQQWDMICDLIGADRHMYYASSCKHLLENAIAKAATLNRDGAER